MKGTQELSLHALPGYALIELSAKYDHIEAPVKAYESKTTGIVRDLDTSDDYSHLLNKRVFWETYKEGAPITRDNIDYTYVKVEDLQGWEDA